MPASTLSEIVAPRDLQEALAVERVQVDVEAPQAGVVQRLRPVAASSTPLVVSARSSMPGIAASLRDQHRQIAPHQRLAAGDPQLA